MPVAKSDKSRNAPKKDESAPTEDRNAPDTAAEAAETPDELTRAEAAQAPVDQAEAGGVSASGSQTEPEEARTQAEETGADATAEEATESRSIEDMEDRSEDHAAEASGASQADAPAPQADTPGGTDAAQADDTPGGDIVEAETKADAEGDTAEIPPSSQAEAPETDMLAAGAAGAAAGAAMATPWERGKPAGHSDAAQEADRAEKPAPSSAPPERIVEKTVVKRGGFFTAFLGGIVAAALGFGAARYVVPEGWPFPGTTGGEDFRTEVMSRLDTQAEQIGGLDSELGDLRASIPEAPDLSPLETRIEDNASTLGSRIDEMSARIDGLDARVTEIAKAPMDQGLSEAAVAAYEQELQSLQDAVAAQRAEVERMVQDATSREQAAADAARAAQAGAALARVRSALDEGAPFAEALADLRGSLDTPVPEALAAVAQDGVTPLSTLREDFPEAARAALSAARSAGTQEEEDAGNRLTAFFEKQLNVRSVAPREGDDPDAVLSRAEAALRDGRLGDTLSEIAALPEDARAELSGWAAQAQARHDAVAAAETLAQSLNQ